MLFKPSDWPRPHLLGQAVHYFYSGKIALVDGSVESLPRKRFQMQGPVGAAIKKAADVILEFGESFLSPFDKTKSPWGSA